MSSMWPIHNGHVMTHFWQFKCFLIGYRGVIDNQDYDTKYQVGYFSHKIQ